MNEAPTAAAASSAPLTPSRAGFSLGRLRRLAAKELKETLRDRRTIITLVLMPLLVYPLLSLIFKRFALPAIGGNTAIVGWESEQEGNILVRVLDRGDPLLERRPQTAASAETIDSSKLQPAPSVYHNVADAVDAGEVDLGVRFQFSRPLKPGGEIPPFTCELIYRRGSLRGEGAADYIEGCMREINALYMRNVLARAGLPPLLPADPQRRALEAPGNSTGHSLSILAPLVLILMTITGAVYPAIDLTAGERERNTLETLIAAPTPRLALLLAKYIAVLTVAVLTAIVNLSAMTGTILFAGLGPQIFGEEGLTPDMAGRVFLLLILFAAFFSALLLAVTSFARSFKEAQVAVIPLMLFALAPGLLSTMPGLEFRGPLTVAPLVNIILLARDTFSRDVDPTAALAAILSTTFYAAAALGLAARIFGTDAVLYGSRGSWGDLLRRPRPGRLTPDLSAAMFALAILFPASFVVANVLLQWKGTEMTTRLALVGLGTAILYAGIPAIAAHWQRLPWSTAFGLRRASLPAFLGASILGFSLWPFAHELVLLSREWGLATIGEQQFQAVSKLLEQWRQGPLWLLLASLAFAPAICEELFFRGYLFAGLQRRMPNWGVVAASALLFGLFHVVTGAALTTERLLPSAALGLVLAWVRLRTGSVLPSILLHACHNGLLITVAYYHKSLSTIEGAASQQEHLPLTWLAAAAIASAVGAALVGLLGRRVESEPGAAVLIKAKSDETAASHC